MLKYIIYVILVLSFTSPAFAQEPIAEIPFEIENNRIKLRMTLNGEPLRLMLDTGAGTSVFFQSSVFDKLDKTKGPLINFPAFAKNFKSERLPNLHLACGDFILQISKAVILPKDENISSQLSLGYDGILGQEIFEKYAVVILTLSKRSSHFTLQAKTYQLILKNAFL